MAPPPRVPEAPPLPTPEGIAAQILATLPRFYATRDLLEVFGGRDPLLTAYLHNRLDDKAISVLEADARLPVWLLARLVGRVAAETP